MVRSVTLAVAPGRAVVILGRNGVGKTTLLSAVMGLLPLRYGSVLLDGQDMTSWQPHRRAAAGLGYVPQGRGVFPHLTVRENILLGLEAALPRRRAEAPRRSRPGAHRREAEAALDEALAACVT